MDETKEMSVAIIFNEFDMESRSNFRENGPRDSRDKFPVVWRSSGTLLGLKQSGKQRRWFAMSVGVGGHVRPARARPRAHVTAPRTNNGCPS